MRRSDKAIIDREEIAGIMQQAQVCRLGMCDGNRPYVIPMSFGIAGNSVYLHSATEGRKLDLLRANPQVCIEFDVDVEIVPGETSCKTTTRYRSVIGFGTATIINTREEHCAGLRAIILHYVDHCTDFPEEMLQRTAVIRVDLHEVTGKKAGY